MAASFLQLAFIARLYPSTFVGQYQLALAWLFLVTAFACFGGIVMVATRELSGSNDPNDAKSIFSNALTLQIMIGVPVCVICVFVFRYSPCFTDLAMPLSIGTVALVGSMILQMSQALLISQEKISSVVVASIVGHLFATVATIVAAFQNLSIVTLGRPAKPLPTAKADLEPLFEFSRWKKILNVSQWIHLRFFPISKIEYQLNLHFLATGRFCRPSLGRSCDFNVESDQVFRGTKSREAASPLAARLST